MTSLPASVTQGISREPLFADHDRPRGTARPAAGWGAVSAHVHRHPVGR
jgi:hypothetical protein